MKELISIIIPIYNAGAYLERAIKSALNQTYSNIEILLLDDGSIDSSHDICKRYDEKYENIIFVRNENQGVGKTRQLGVQLAKGNYLCFLDADDFLDERFVEKLLSVALEKNADVVNCGFFEVYPGGRLVERSAFCEKISRSKMLMEMFSNPNVGTYFWNRLWKKELFSKIQVSDAISFEDLATTYQLVLNAETIVGISEALYYYVHENSMSLTGKWTGEKSTLYFAAYENAKTEICEAYPELNLFFDRILVIAAMNDCKALYKNKKSDKTILRRIRSDWKYICENKNLLSKKEQLEADLICKNPKLTRSLLLLKQDLNSKKWK